MSWLIRLAAGLSSQSPEIDRSLFYVRFVVDCVALGRGFLKVFRFSSFRKFLPIIHTHFSSIIDAISARYRQSYVNLFLTEREAPLESGWKQVEAGGLEIRRINANTFNKQLQTFESVWSF